jgi:hypothetical protein
MSKRSWFKFILAPMGSGKTEFLEDFQAYGEWRVLPENQVNGEWKILPDCLHTKITETSSLFAQPTTEYWWRDGVIMSMVRKRIKEIIDIMDFDPSFKHIIISDQLLFEPDAVVIIPEDEHKLRLTNNPRGHIGIEDWQNIKKTRDAWKAVYETITYNSISDAIDGCNKNHERGVYVDIPMPNIARSIQLKKDVHLTLFKGYRPVSFTEKVKRKIEGHVTGKEVSAKSLLITTKIKDEVEWYTLSLKVSSRVIDEVASLIYSTGNHGYVKNKRIVVYRTTNYDDLLEAWDVLSKDWYVQLKLGSVHYKK